MMIISYIAITIPLIPAGLGLFYWPRLLPGERWFTIMLVIIALNGLAGYLGEKLFQNNMPFFHAYILVECLMLIQVFRFVLVPYVRDRLFTFCIIGFGLAWLLNVVLIDGIMGYPTYILVIEGLLLISFAVCWFAKVLHERVEQHPARLFAFWLSTAVLIFFSGNLLLFLFSNFVFVQAKHVYLAIWDVHALLVIVLYSLYSIAILWARKNPILS